MADLFREHVRRSGDAKARWPSKEDALRDCPLNQAPHLCGLCRWWHRHTISTPRKEMPHA